jgi:hypothetical protein
MDAPGEDATDVTLAAASCAGTVRPVRRLPVSLALAAGLLAAAPAAGSAAVRHASPTSTNAVGSCLSPATACTLKRAVDAAVLNDEIVVASGRYDVTGVLDLPGGAFLHGVAGERRPQIVSTVTTSALTTTVGGDGLTQISGIELSAPAADGVIFTNGDSAVIDGVVLTDTKPGGKAFVEGGITAGTTLRDSIVTATGAGSLGALFGGQASHMRNVTVWATGAGAIGVKAYSDHFTIGMSCVGQGNGNVDLLASAVHGDGTDLVVEKVGDCGPFPRLAATSSAFVTKSGIGGAAVDVTGGDNISLDPATAFVAPGTDFHAPPTSALVDAGATDTLSGNADVDGLARVRGAAVDIGAGEFFTPDGVLFPVSAGPTFNGAVAAHGMKTTASFEYGPSTAYGTLTPEVAVAADDTTHALAVAPAGLDPAVALHVRLHVTSGNANYSRTSTSADGAYTPPAVTPPVVMPPVVTPPVVTPPVRAKPRCVVPKLARFTRAGARKRLLKAHCALGKVTGRAGGRVSTQSRRPGTKLPAGTKVAIRLKPVARKRP